MRLAARARVGRPGAEYRTLERAPRAPVPTQRPTAGHEPSERADAGVADSRAAGDGALSQGDNEPEPNRRSDRANQTVRAGVLSVREQLVVRCVGALIGSIERASMLRDVVPPRHVDDRIERLLEI